MSPLPPRGWGEDGVRGWKAGPRGGEDMAAGEWRGQGVFAAGMGVCLAVEAGW